MRQVETNYTSFGVPGFGDTRKIKSLSRVVIHAAEHNQRDLFSFYSDEFFDVFSAGSGFAGTGRDFNQRIFRIVTVILNL